MKLFWEQRGISLSSRGEAISERVPASSVKVSPGEYCWNCALELVSPLELHSQRGGTGFARRPVAASTSGAFPSGFVPGPTQSQKQRRCKLRCTRHWRDFISALLRDLPS